MTLARPVIWGHRGASFEAPENTLAAFRLAREQGADGVELDAQRCASGEIVVMHDESLGRTTGFAGLVTETAFSVIQTLDAGRGERVPLLSDVLEQVPIRINVELKCDRANDRGLTAEVVRLVREAGAQDRVLLSDRNTGLYIIDGILTAAGSYQGIIVRVLILYFLVQGLIALRELKRRQMSGASPGSAAPRATPVESSIPPQDPPTY